MEIDQNIKALGELLKSQHKIGCFSVEKLKRGYSVTLLLPGGNDTFKARSMDEVRNIVVNIATDWIVDGFLRKADIEQATELINACKELDLIETKIKRKEKTEKGITDHCITKRAEKEGIEISRFKGSTIVIFPNGSRYKYNKPLYEVALQLKLITQVEYCERASLDDRFMMSRE